MAPQFILTEAKEDDCADIVRLHFEACADDPGFSTMFPTIATPAMLQHYTQQFKRDLKDDPTCHMYLARESGSKETASFAIWYFYPERHQDEIDEEMLTADFNFPEGSNREAGNLLTRNGLCERHEIMGTQAYAFLAATGTSAKWRRQGAASLLLEHGLSMADRQALPTYVGATPVAMRLYARFGFTEVAKRQLELGRWKDGEFWNACMVRPARKASPKHVRGGECVKSQ